MTTPDKNSRDHLFDLALLLLAVFLIYFRAAFFGLTFLDDHVWLLERLAMFKTPSAPAVFFIQPDIISALFYRPLIAVSFWFTTLFNADLYAVNHVLNILLHAANACFVYALFRAWGYRRRTTLFCSLIFAAHPVLVSAVAWIPGRTDSLLAFFLLPSLISFIRFRLTGKYFWLAVHWLCWALALFTKETAVVLPLITLIYLGTLEKAQRRWPATGILVCLWAITGSVWFMLRAHVLGAAGHVDPGPSLISMGGNLSAFVSYLGKIGLPVNLSVLPIPRDLPLLYGWITLIVICSALVFTRKPRWRFVCFGVVWYVLFIWPSLTLSFINHEYRLYLPLLGVLIVLAETDWFDQAVSNSRGTMAVAAVIVVLGALSLVHAGKYHDRFSFWQDAARHSPHSPLAHRNLGAMLYLDGKIEAAESEYKKALALNANEPMVHNNLGLIYLTRGDGIAAETAFRKEIQINPGFANAYYNLGIVYWGQKRFHDAAVLWQKTLERDPYHSGAPEKLSIYQNTYNKGNI